jgi:hypothetical protein
MTKYLVLNNIYYYFTQSIADIVGLNMLVYSTPQILKAGTNCCSHMSCREEYIKESSDNLFCKFLTMTKCRVFAHVLTNVESIKIHGLDNLQEELLLLSF